MEESRESCKVTQGNRAGQEWSVTRGNAIGVGGSQIAGTVGGRAASQAEVREGSEADLQNRGKTRNVRRKNVPVVNVIGHRRTGLALTSSRVVEEEEDLLPTWDKIVPVPGHESPSGRRIHKKRDSLSE